MGDAGNAHVEGRVGANLLVHVDDHPAAVLDCALGEDPVDLAVDCAVAVEARLDPRVKLYVDSGAICK